MRYNKCLLIRKISFLAAPIITSPLLFFGKESKCIYVILVMCIYWVTECIPMGITSLVPLFLFPVLEIMKAKDLSVTYFMDTTVLAIASLLMGNAVEEVNLHKRIALGMLKYIGYRKHFLLMGTIFVTGLVSMCVADMAACAMMLPIIMAILRTLQEVRDRQAALSSSSTEKTKEPPSSSLESISLEESSTKSTTKREEAAGNSSETKTDIHHLDLNSMSKADRGFAKALVMACATSALFGGKGTLTGSTPNIVFREQFGPVEVVSYLQWASFGIPFMLVALVFNYFVLTAVFILPTRLGKEKEAKLFSERKNDQLNIMTKHKIQEEYNSLGRFSFAEGSVLVWFLLLIIAWMTRNPGFAPGWGSLLPAKDIVTDGTTAVLVAVAMFIWPKSFKDKKLEPILTWKVMKTTFSWQCVLLVAVGNAISEGVKSSGLSVLMGCHLSRLFKNLSPFWLQVLAQLAASIISEFTSNTSTAGIFTPIMRSIANGFRLNPLYLVLPAIFASSYGFMMPMATPANAIVYDTGMLTLWEMCAAGFVLKLVAIVLTAVNFETLAYKLLKLDQPLPAQLNTFNYTASCN